MTLTHEKHEYSPAGSTEPTAFPTTQTPSPAREDDLTGLKMAVQTVAAISEDWVYWLEPDGTMSFLSAAGRQLTGRTLSDFQNNPGLLVDLVHPEDRPLWEGYHEAVQQSIRPVDIEIRIQTPQAQTRWIRHRCRRFFSSNGECLGTLGTSSDVTEAKRLERQMVDFAQEMEWQNWRLGEAYEELARINQELDDFAHIASHDLREPLRGLRLYAGILNQDYAARLDDGARKKLDTMVRLCDRLDVIIESLLQYSRVGRQEFLSAETDLNQLVADVLSSLQVSLDEGRVEVHIPECLPRVVCDPVRIREVFHNLIVNAMKYNDAEKKLIEIGSFMEIPDDRDLDQWGGEGDRRQVFYVSDNGIGIPEEHRDTVFRLFKRLHPAQRYGAGTGFGLTMTKKIVERHGGRIWVESKPGQGATFYFTLGKKCSSGGGR